MTGVFFVLLAIVLLLLFGGALLGLAFDLLWLVLVGLVIGALGRLTVSGTEGMSLLSTALLGIAGALLGGILADALDVGWILELVLAVLVAGVLIWAFVARPARS